MTSFILTCTAILTSQQQKELLSKLLLPTSWPAVAVVAAGRLSVSHQMSSIDYSASVTSDQVMRSHDLSGSSTHWLASAPCCQTCSAAESSSETLCQSCPPSQGYESSYWTVKAIYFLSKPETSASVIHKE